ncbi:hypothetical protein [Mogibacterium diversum]|uniref:hypothetical protein n=1 Tax=Mogibacterium diversum TaxID=114527 RepID=UPI0028E8D79B|nr:hypothetical protein [Mogibacterium diversum]
MKYSNENCILNSVLVTAPVIIGAVIGEYIIYKDGGDMNTGIVVALIGVAGAVIGNIFILLRDRNAISRIDSKSSEIEPVTKTIKEKTDKISDYTVEKIYPDMKSMHVNQEKVARLVGDIHEDVRYRQRLSKEYAGSLSKDIMVTGIEDVYSENANLVDKVRELESFNNNLKVQLEIKEEEIRKLKKYNIKLENSMNKYRKKDHDVEI